MEVKLCGQVLNIPDGLNDEEKDKLLKDFVNKVSDDIPPAAFEDACDRAWVAVYGELTDERKQEIKAKQGLEQKSRDKRAAAGSEIVVLSEDDMKIMQEVMKADERYKARKKRERAEK